MMILDTNVLVEIFDKESHLGEEALRKTIESGEDISITVINLHEMLYGLEKYAKPVRDILEIPTLSYTKRDAALSARIEVDMEIRGTPVRRADAMIAAIAINNSARLYTFDMKHFRPIEALGLRLFT